MYDHVFLKATGNCDANEKHAGVEVVQVTDPLNDQVFHFCAKCFFSQLRLKAKGKRVGLAAPIENGQPHEFTRS